MTPMKKTQAALEFLTTYAWALLGISILIGSLAYFGILTPSKLLPDRCNAGSEIGCIQYVIKQDGVRLKLTNNAGSTIIVESISLLNEGAALCAVIPPISGLPGNWRTGEAADLQITSAQCAAAFLSAGIVVNEKKKIGFEIIYHTPQGGGAFKKSVQGEVFSTVQQGNV